MYWSPPNVYSESDIVSQNVLNTELYFECISTEYLFSCYFPTLRYMLLLWYLVVAMTPAVAMTHATLPFLAVAESWAGTEHGSWCQCSHAVAMIPCFCYDTCCCYDTWYITFSCCSSVLSWDRAWILMSVLSCCTPLIVCFNLVSKSDWLWM